MSNVRRSFWARGGRSVWRVLVVALALLLLATPALAASGPLTGTFGGKVIGRDVTFSHGGKQRTDWAGVLNLKLDGGPTIPVFCIEIDIRVRAGDRYRSDGAVLALPNGCQIRYLLDKYPGSSAKTAGEAAARQMAIWVFSDGVDPAKIDDATVRARTIALVNEAKKGACPTRRTAPPDLAIQPPVGSAAPGQPIAYTLRAGPADAGAVATIVVNGTATLADAQQQPAGQQLQVTLDAQGVATFWVTNASAGQTAIRVSLPYRLEAGTVFSHIEDARRTQRLVMAESQRMTAAAEARASWSSQAPQPTPPTQPTPAPTQPPSERPPEQHAPQSQPPEVTSNILDQVAAHETPSPAQAPTAAPDTSPAGAAPQRPVAAQPAAQPASAVVVPRSLPNTAGSDGMSLTALLLVAALILCGILVRRKASSS
jgi:hypothetical protein